MNNDKASKQITIRITEELHERLNAEAESQSRPLANYVKAIIIEHFAAIDRVKKIAEKK